MFKHFLVRTLWTIIFLIALLLVLAFVWDVPSYLGYNIPTEFSKLPVTMFLVVAIIAGVAGTWTSRTTTTTKIIEKQVDTPPAPETTTKEDPK